MLAGVFCLSGVSPLVTRMLAKDKYKNKRGFLILNAYIGGGIFGLIGFSLLYFSSEVIAYKFYGDASYAIPLKYAAIGSIPYSISCIQNGILAGLGRFDQISKAIILYAILLILGTQISIYFYEIEEVLISHIFATSFQVLFLGYFIYNNYLKNINLTRKWKKIIIVGLKEIVSKSTYLAISSVFVSLANWYVMGLAAKNFGGEAIVILLIANQWKNMILFIPSSMGQILLQRFSAIYSDRVNSLRYLKLAVSVNAIVGLVVVSLLILASEKLLAFYGNQIQVEYLIYDIVILSAFFVSISNILTKYLMVSYGAIFVFWSDLTWTLLLIFWVQVLVVISVLEIALSFVYASIGQLLFQLLLLKVLAKK
jgi:O-antigen/teichoic acid export membrane protein